MGHDDKLWADARTLADLGDLTARWLEGDIDASHPGGYDEPDPETIGIIPALAAMNRAGFVTTCSQPGGLFDHYFYPGWKWHQRAAVDGFADHATLARIRAAATGTDLMVIAHRTPPRQRLVPYWVTHGRGWRYRCAVPCTAAIDGDVGTVLGAHLSYEDIIVGWEWIGDEAFDAILAAWQVTVIDPMWTRNDLLWPALSTLANERD